MCIESETGISNFLYQLKFIADDLSRLQVVERDKNLATLAELGISMGRAVQEIILHLTFKDYVKGPDPDRQYPQHNVWVFGKKYDSRELYIKFSDDLSRGVVICISFHFSESSLSYPYK